MRAGMPACARERKGFQGCDEARKLCALEFACVCAGVRECLRMMSMHASVREGTIATYCARARWLTRARVRVRTLSLVRHMRWGLLR